MKRKPIAIGTCGSEVIVLCNDGTIFLAQQCKPGEEVWEQLADVPQPRPKKKGKEPT